MVLVKSMGSPTVYSHMIDEPWGCDRDSSPCVYVSATRDQTGYNSLPERGEVTLTRLTEKYVAGAIDVTLAGSVEEPDDTIRVTGEFEAVRKTWD